jgi:tetratricopeptide (TPR) repeat protein
LQDNFNRKLCEKAFVVMKDFARNTSKALPQMLAAARQAQRSGQREIAERIYTDILAAAPKAWDVHHELALLLARTGRVEQAIRHFQLIVRAHPAHAPSQANLANALAEAGRLPEAIDAFEKALALDPGMMGAKLALAETLRQAGKLQLAADTFKSVLDRDKTNHTAFNGLGLVFHAMGDLPRSLECFEFAVGNAPKAPRYRMNFALALRQYGLNNFAAEQLYQAAMLKPDWLEAVVLLGEVLQELGRFDEAKECFERGKQINPDAVELDERIGYTYLGMGDVEHASAVFNQVLSNHPDRLMANLGIGRTYMEAGHTQQAGQAFETVIEKYPDNPAGYSYLAASRKFTQGEKAISEMHRLAEQISDEDTSTAISINFALGKVYDDCQDWENAWKYYSRGNSIKNTRHNYHPDGHEKKITELISIFSQDFIQKKRSIGYNSTFPVLIVGMPRSGTTLTEQIISSHPQVIGGGEVKFWGQAYEALPLMLKTRQPYPFCVPAINREQIESIAEKYIELLTKIAGPDAHPLHVTDKMPHNFVHLGLISIIFPEIPIIHCKRNAMDNCLSIFFQNFGNSHSYAFNLANLGHHYKQYQRLMEHWHEVLPGRIMDINYEDTIADPEYWSRKLIEHVGLEWDDACLAPHKLERTVKTASHWQVRQPIYKTSVQRWKNYEQYLGPLKEALGYEG